jgi:AbrB family looped-hinge helix DNA binding protein
MSFQIKVDRLLDRVMQGRARVNQWGRIVIPVECRSAAGIKPGDEVLITLVGEGELRSEPADRPSTSHRASSHGAFPSPAISLRN